MCTEINIKENMPLVCDALENLKGYIKIKKHLGIRCLVVIHGYGSTGKGGEICKKSRAYLKSQEKNKHLKSVIFGEDFDVYNKSAVDLNAKYKALNKYFCKYNHGITIIEL